jgi:hypothetical protein
LASESSFLLFCRDFALYASKLKDFLDNFQALYSQYIGAGNEGKISQAVVQASLDKIYGDCTEVNILPFLSLVAHLNVRFSSLQILQTLLDWMEKSDKGKLQFEDESVNIFVDVLNKALQVVELILRHDKYRAKVTISCASR